MRTPQNYTQLVNDKKITNEMIAECIYSVNKRAKNHRDRIRKYKEDRYNPYAARNIENAEDEMEKYYTMKEEMLTVFEPSLIHEQYVGEEKKRVFSTEEDYDKLLQEKSNDILRKGSYYDDENSIEVEFFDYKLGRKKYLYFLFYEIGEYSFHLPISEQKDKKYTKLQIKEIDQDFKTHGANIEGLLSTQFVNKVLSLLQSGDYKIVE
ncbi:hypothetical protein [Streptococcus mutans]|uniref:hypothetical protein n=1 Tax=Streptococcus mutans TaxID=1309 RepID=UPI000463D592|nr:hypothetical protein [Streptococcus mutans]